MGQPAARMNDQVSGVDMHVVLVPSPGGPVPTPLPHPFTATIVGGASTVLIGGQPAAAVGDSTQNMPPHVPTPPGTSFVTPPTNQGTIMVGSPTVLIGGKQAARQGDSVLTCGDPPAPGGTIASGCPTVMIG